MLALLDLVISTYWSNDPTATTVFYRNTGETTPGEFIGIPSRQLTSLFLMTSKMASLKGKLNILIFQDFQLFAAGY